MKDFKLKAVIKETKEIVEIDNINFEVEQIGYFYNKGKSYNHIDFEEVILLKSTGLYDSKGVEIFEGDIFEDIDAKYTIFWDKEKVGFRVLQEFFDSEYLTCDSDILEIGDFNFQKEELEIIGNIHTKEEA